MDFLKALPGRVDLEYLNKLEIDCQKKWKSGNGPRYQEYISQFDSVIPTEMSVVDGIVSLDGKFPIESNNDTLEELGEKLMKLAPWRKGPFRVGGVDIEAEWRSDYKWQRLEKALPELRGRRILDIGANNGYFMFRMLEHEPELVLGLEPTQIYAAQFEALKKFCPSPKLQMTSWGVEHLEAFDRCFDVIFSMGILYHHRSPLQQLYDMRGALRPGGTLILETIGIPGEEPVAITPPDRYAGMKNIWLLPTLSMLITWLERSKFIDVEVISTEWGELSEQRATEWSGVVSLADFLDADNQELTKEGLPAPKRFLLKASRK